MFRIFLTTILATLLAGVSGYGPQAHASQRVTFVLDASGSMWRDVGGVTRFDLARRALDVFLRGLPERTEVALVVFGHRLRGDCFDVEAFDGRRGRRTLMDTVQTLVPKGKTCLSRALRTVQGRSGSIVILGDGPDRCGEHACAVAGALAAEAGGPRIHVLGLAPEERDARELECIAGRAGGVYRFVPSPGTLEPQAQALLAVLGEPQAPRPGAERRTDETPQPARLLGTGAARLAPQPWVRAPAVWGLADPESGIERARSTSDQLSTEAGWYQPFWQQAGSGASRVYLPELVEVVPGGTRAASVSTGIRFEVPDGIGPPYFWRLLDVAGEQAVRVAGSLAPQPAPSGAYRLRWKQSQHGHPELPLEDVRIERGRLNTISLDGGVDVVLAEWLSPPYELVLRGAGGEHRFSRPSGRSLFLPGRYRVQLRQTRHHHRPVEWGTVEVPEEGFLRIEVDSGVRFGPETGRAPARIVAIPRQAGARSVLNDSRGPMPLPPGQYQFHVQLVRGAPSWMLEGVFQIRKGELLEVTLQEPDGE